MPFHLVVDCRFASKSGIGRYIREIMMRIIDSGLFDVTILGYSDDSSLFRGKFNYIKMNSCCFSLSEQFELLIKTPKCDFFWSPHFNIPIILPQAKRRGVTIHDIYPLIDVNGYGFLKKLIAKLYFWLSVTLNDLIFTVSSFSKFELTDFFGIKLSEKIIPIHNGVTTEIEGFKVDGLVSFGLHENSDFILMVGNVKPHKNQMSVLNAFARLVEKGDIPLTYRLVIAGETENFRDSCLEMKSFDHSYLVEDRVVFTGRVSDDELKWLYSHASLFVFPSRYEGFGLPILEAMSYNLKILSSNRASLPEVGGSYIEYFDVDDSFDLDKKLVELINTHPLPSGFYLQHLKKFCWDSSVSVYISNILSK
ncbi:glycosyltransferase family 4 protein [Aeromonas veronii]|uniref:glycosyltransferase family 4 protein n=1 Tax=Aeromonas veronii TaxID=654 RepID=UPI00236450EE|nr:glycosyltransferase family 1 protein [Aeromonas veronii]MDD1846254.1 glycosyltransferase family 4 protein [Aeromonas veronii]